ncbi:hypothetical protein ACIRQY_10275 [Streptomyces sp. NPDC101490]|uniref:hypothetical protein n=1 Tax=Streptomyces sp. NPDC101490 TaxID=3366143 RepID=UPI00382665E3
MTQNRFSVKAFARHRHGLTAVSLAALASLALTGCGSEVAGGAPQGTSAKNVDTRTSGPAQPSPEPPSPGQKAFEAMLATEVRTCPRPGGDPSVPPGASTGTEPVRSQAPRDTPATEPIRPASPHVTEPVRSLAPGETPPTDPIELGPFTGPGAELNRRDWCASVQHEYRILGALQKVAEPTPAKVRKALNGLGYIDEHIHGLQQDGRTTRFYLDLRESGGQLCEAGLAAGEVSDVNPCVVPATGPFTVTTEDRP